MSIVFRARFDRSSEKNRKYCLIEIPIEASLTLDSVHAISSFFHGHDNYDQLVKIAKVLGTDELFA